MQKIASKRFLIILLASMSKPVLSPLLFRPVPTTPCAVRLDGFPVPRADPGRQRDWIKSLLLNA
jgi:hypothetical protein